jgi:hypothetical protein
MSLKNASALTLTGILLIQRNDVKLIVFFNNPLMVAQEFI